ncbi:Glycosyltransferase involved in cell wall bisynthesis [Bosea sp. TND4EK4]|nr:Glycosyltransferase involved in cell wall bisynthesis [Bosea sp. TND4EK4]
MSATADRLRVLMLCAHEPTMDPRVKWSAASAARSFDVTVLGFNNAAGSLPEQQDGDGYRLVRLPHKFVAVLAYPRAFLEAVPPHLWPVAVLLSPLFALLLLLVALPLALARIMRQAALGIRSALLRHPLGRHVEPFLSAPARRPSEDGSGEEEERRRERSLGSLRARISYVSNLLRMQFGPPALWFTSYIDSLPTKPDTIHCNDLDTLLVGVVARKRYGCRVVYDAHEYYPHCDPYARWLDIWIFSAIEWLLLRRTDAVVTINQPMAEQMSAAYGYRPIYAVPNAEPRADVAVVPMRTAMTDQSDGRLKCLVQGRYSPKRGMEEVIEGWRHVDPRKAALFLRGPENEHSRRGRELAARLGLLDRSVYFLPAVTEDELVAAAAEADIGIIPYLSDFMIYEYACPNKLAQYMHAGLALLSNDLAYVRSVIEWGHAGLIYRVGESGSLAAAVHRLADDADLLSRLKQAATEFARETFNWQAYSPIFDALYRGETPQLEADGTATGRLH